MPTVGSTVGSTTLSSEGFTTRRAGPFFFHWSASARTCRAKTEQLERFEGHLPESQGQHLASTVQYVPHSLGSGVLLDSDGRSSFTGPRPRAPALVQVRDR